MKTYIVYPDGHMQVDNLQEAREISKSDNKVLYIVEIDETKLPEDVKADECIYSEEGKLE